MKVLIPPGSGFCPGVTNAENEILKLKALEPADPIYVYGYLINNRRYIDFLEQQGVHTAASLKDIPDGAIAVIRTHGLDRREEEALRSRGPVIDLTCAKVKKVQEEVAGHAADGFFTVLVGKKNHPETKGHVSYTRECEVIESEEDCARFLAGDRFRSLLADGGKIFLCAQTTAAREIFDLAAGRLHKAGRGRISLAVRDSICPITDRKEQAALRLQPQADVTFVVGDRLSANAAKLFHALSADPRRPALFVEDLEGLRSLRLPLAECRTALVVSSASTPRFVEEEIVRYLESL